MTTRLILSGLLLVAVGVRIQGSRAVAPVDDAFISYRYAANVASGQGFQYNPGERVLGTTTPLYTLLLAAAGMLGASIPRASLLLNIAFDALALLVLFRLGARLHSRAAGIACALVWALAWTGSVSPGYGMETQLFTLLAAIAFWLQLEDRPRASGLAVGLLVLVRPEGVLLGALVALPCLLRPRALAAFVAAASAPVLVFAVAATLYFGSPLPQSVRAKLSQGHVSIAECLRFFVARNDVVLALWIAQLAGFYVALRRGRVVELALLAAPLILLAFYLAVRPVFLGAWYFPPVAFFLCVGAAMSVVRGVAWASAKRSAAVRVRRALYASLIVGWVLLSAAALRSAWRSAGAWKRSAESVYLPLARYQGFANDADATVFASDIGYLGYYSRAHIVDAAGLVSPQVVRAARLGPRGGLAVDVAFVLETLPEYVVLPIKQHIYERFMDSEFRERYEPVARFQEDGEASLVLPRDPSDAYARRGGFVADFLVFRRLG